MHQPREAPVVLVVAGLDPSGGAGLAADVRGVLAAGAFAAPVAATLTVQSTRGLVRQVAVAPSLVVAQADEVLAAQRVRVVKTGALGSAANVRALARLLRLHEGLPLVVDPVRVPTRGGAVLHDARAYAVLKRELVARATLVSSNAEEAEALLGFPVKSRDDAHDAARALVALGARAALVKGGHLRTDRAGFATDVLHVGGAAYEIAAPRLRAVALHGGGCLLASLVAGRLACEARLDDAAIVRAVRFAKSRHHRMLRRGLLDVGGPLSVGAP